MVGKGKVLLMLILGKILILNNILHVLDIHCNLAFVSFLGKTRAKIMFEYDKIVLTENGVFVGKDYCSLGLFMFEYEALNSHAFICHQVFLFFFVLVNSCNLGEG